MSPATAMPSWSFPRSMSTALRHSPKDSRRWCGTAWCRTRSCSSKRLSGKVAMAGLRAAVFLDRDGVINRALVRRGKPAAPRRLEDYRLLPGAAAAVRDLKAAGLAVIVITNQPDIGNGLVPAEVVEAMHRKLRARIPVDDILVC